MKSIFAVITTALLLVTSLAPASAATKCSVNQKTLATFSSTIVFNSFVHICVRR